MLQPSLKSPHATTHTEYYINVPQGRGARLELNSLAVTSGKIVGLHTHDFTICDIVVITSKSKIVMYHVDRMSMFFFIENLQEELKQVKDESYAIFHIRKDAGAATAKIIDDLLSAINPPIKLQTRIIGDNITGVILSFNNSKEPDNLPGISLDADKAIPGNVLFHPEEERLMSVRIIEGMIGKRAMLASEQFKNCMPYVFDGMGWVVMPPHEFVVGTPHPLTKEELDLFSTNDSYFIILEKLLNFFQTKGGELIVVGNGATEAGAKLTARHLENYLNAYDPNKILKKNMLYILKKISDTKLTQEDLAWKNKLITAVENFEHEPDQSLAVYRSFCTSSATDPVKRQVIDNFNLLFNHFEVRHFHKSKSQGTLSARERANKNIKVGVGLMQTQNNLGAKPLLADAVSEAIRSCLLSDNNLVGAHSHMATCFYRLGIYHEAVEHFKRAINLYEKYFDKTELVKKKIETLRNGLLICQSKINETTSTVQKTVLSAPAP